MNTNKIFEQNWMMMSIVCFFAFVAFLVQKVEMPDYRLDVQQTCPAGVEEAFNQCLISVKGSGSVPDTKIDVCRENVEKLLCDKKETVVWITPPKETSNEARYD